MTVRDMLCLDVMDLLYYIYFENSVGRLYHFVRYIPEYGIYCGAFRSVAVASLLVNYQSIPPPRTGAELKR
jgi:hypothetical protein